MESHDVSSSSMEEETGIASPQGASPENTDPKDASPKDAPKKESLVKEITGDLFDAPDGSALIHACNTRGHWGKGIALTFRKKYPRAYRLYAAYCRILARNKPDLEAQDDGTTTSRFPLGTALILRPLDRRDDQLGHHIVCLFTSTDYGQRADPTDRILENTRSALQDLKSKLQAINQQQKDFGKPAPTGLYACRFNSGLFGVPWAKTRQLVEEVGLEMTVVHPE